MKVVTDTKLDYFLSKLLDKTGAKIYQATGESGRITGKNGNTCSVNTYTIDIYPKVRMKIFELEGVPQARDAYTISFSKCFGALHFCGAEQVGGSNDLAYRQYEVSYRYATSYVTLSFIGHSFGTTHHRALFIGSMPDA